MKERPILFNSEMVRALLNGTKTQTRRIIKDAIGAFWDHGAYKPILDVPQSGIQAWIDPEGRIFSETAPTPLCPFGQPGDRLWVRETFTAFVEHHKVSGEPQFAYAADMNADCERHRQDYIKAGFPYQWKPSIHMPRAASRITLEITTVRVEKLNEISDEDALSEGIERRPCDCAMDGTLRDVCPHSKYKTHFKDYADKENLSLVTPGCSFMSLWESINGPGSYYANPWVWVIEFKRVTP